MNDLVTFHLRHFLWINMIKMRFTPSKESDEWTLFLFSTLQRQIVEKDF